MPASILGDRSEEGDVIVQGVLNQVSALPETEAEFITAVENTCLNLRSLIIIAMDTEKEIVTGWQESLHHVPDAIGLHPEFSNKSQQRIDMLRGRITERIDEELPTLGRSLGDDDSGIFLTENMCLGD